MVHLDETQHNFFSHSSSSHTFMKSEHSTQFIRIIKILAVAADVEKVLFFTLNANITPAGNTLHCH